MAADNWRDGVRVHPAADTFPMMSDAELDALAADIAEHGPLQGCMWFRGPDAAPDEEPQLLDGRNRLAAADRIADQQVRKQARSWWLGYRNLLPSTVDPYVFVCSANIHRRHLTAEQKREVTAKLIKANPERSDRATAKLADVSHPTASAVRRELEAKGDVERLSTRTDSAGRQQPARKPAPGVVVGRLPAPRAPATFDGVSLDAWKKLDEAAQTSLLRPQLAPGAKPPRFNKQESADIEWAQWSTNPITGCLHDCPYCYAREIAESSQMAAAYPNGFEPTIHPRRLLAAAHTPVPLEAVTDTRYRNVFLGSMADLWGGWVPDPWLAAVLKMIGEAPQWNFLTLTKFPKRMMDFEIPPNCWAGTTVDLQARVTSAEAAFAEIGAAVKWLSCEPLLEPLRFQHLDRFDWIVIGGASRSTKTPDFHPPFEWIADLVKQARDAGLKIYMKSNLGITLDSRILELPFEAPIKANPTKAPEVFHYLRKRIVRAAADARTTPSTSRCSGSTIRSRC